MRRVALPRPDSRVGRRHPGRRVARRLAPAALAAALAAFPGAAAAACLSGGIPGGVSARIDAKLLEQLAPVIVREMPTEFAVPETPVTVFECPPPADDTVITPLRTTAHVKVNSLQVRFAAGAIELEASLDLEVQGDLKLQLCVLEDDTCPAHVSARGVEMYGRLEPRVRQCEPEFPITDFVLVPDRRNTTITLSRCGMYNEIWDAIYGWFQGSILTSVSQSIGRMVENEVPPLLESVTTGLLSEGLEFGKLRVTAATTAIAITEREAIVTFDGDVRPIGDAPACLPRGATLPSEAGAPAPKPAGDALVALSVSHALVQRAVRASWLGGLLCFDTSEFGLDLSTPLDFLAPGVQVSGKLAVLTPPAVELRSGAAGRISVAAAQVRADVTLAVPGHEASTLSATLGVAADGDVAIDPKLQSLVIDLSEAHATSTAVTTPGAVIPFSGAALQSLLDRSLLPMFAEYRGKMPLLGNLFLTAPLAVRIDKVDVRTGSVQADLELYPKDPTDDVPPVTRLAGDPPGPSLDRFALDVASTDDRTPARFLRHRVLVDGKVHGATDEELPSGTRIVLSGLADGPHRVSLRAVDLNDNEAPQAVQFDVRVDTAEPVVTLGDAPLGVVRGTSLRVTVDAADETTPSDKLRLGYRLSIVRSGNQPDDPLEEGDLLPGEGVSLGGLPEDKVLRLVVHATDEAGNVGEGEIAFFCNPTPTLGCATLALPAALPALALLLFARRRRAGARP